MPSISLGSPQVVAMSRAWLAVTTGAALAATLLVPASAASAASVPLPDSMAAVGDSITQAFDVDPEGLFQENPAYSWSTGTSTSVDSEYERILSANPAIQGHAYNDAVPGSMMSALDGQVKTAAAQGVQYLTVEIGADDLCVDSVADMTPTATFRSEFQQALTDFTASDPAAHIFVASIPNIYQVWQDENSIFLAELIWNILPFCTDMLDVGVTSAQQQQIIQQEQADNQVLGDVCAEFSQCLFDNDAVYKFAISPADVSGDDYFHPSIAGQQALASTAWGAGFWPGTP
jgi:lysophospholipase L1-like esterase